MPSIIADGIRTRYAVTGDGPPLLLYSPGGFDSRLENWTDFGIYGRLKLIEHLSTRYTCITFDRRESGRSGGRIERVEWSDYVAQGAGVLDHLGIRSAFLMGGCVGCSSIAAFATTHPERTRGLVLFSPAGGPRYRIMQQARFAEHAGYARSAGLNAVVELARSSAASFSQDARVGPWVSVIRTDDGFAATFARHDLDDYLLVLSAMARAMFDRDTVPGPEPEDLMRLRVPALIVPGADASHAPSAAHYLMECLIGAQLWDVPVPTQTQQNAPSRVLAFLDDASS